jgi:two-component system, LuxR family, sensor histidine kinase DctS
VVKAEEEIERQKKLFESVIINAPYALLMTNMEQEIILCNPAFSSVFGYECNDVKGRTTEFLFKNREAYEKSTHLRNVLLDGSNLEPFRREYKRRNGELFQAETALAPIADQEEHIYGFIALIRDITPKIKQEEENRRYQEVISHSRRLSLLGEMSAGLAHELNQPLSAIANYASGCIQRLQNENVDRDQLLRVMTTVSEQADRAGKIINRIRGFIKNEISEIKPVYLNELVTESLSLIETDLDLRNVSVNLDIDNSRVTVNADKIQMQQVILNLVRNACDAMDASKGKERNIFIRTIKTNAEEIELSVSDTGPGIPAEK